MMGDASSSSLGENTGPERIAPTIGPESSSPTTSSSRRCSTWTEATRYGAGLAAPAATSSRSGHGREDGRGLRLVGVNGVVYGADRWRPHEDIGSR